MAPQCNHTLTTSMYAHGDKSLIEMGAKKIHSLIIMPHTVVALFLAPHQLAFHHLQMYMKKKLEVN